MNMKVKAPLIQQLRNERLWSQQQLAETTGLGLRTVQRIESSGNASMESVKALAAVFEVDAKTLMMGELKAYRHRQWSFVMPVVLILAEALVLALHGAFGFPNAVLWILLVEFVVIAVLFSSMTIEVDGVSINWHFGPGLIRKSTPLSEVASCQTVKNPWWMGFGVHGFGTGWIYNVSGLLGVEIKLKGGASIRLGSDEPNYLASAINEALAHQS